MSNEARKQSLIVNKKLRRNSNLFIKNIKIVTTKEYENKILFHYGECIEKPIDTYIVEGCIDTLKVRENPNTGLSETQFKDYINILFSFKEYALVDTLLEKNNFQFYKPEKVTLPNFTSTQTIIKKLNIEIFKGNNPSQIRTYHTFFFQLGKTFNFGDKIQFKKSHITNHIYIITQNSYASIVPESFKDEYEKKFRLLQIRREHVHFLQGLPIFNMLLKENFDKYFYDKFTYYNTKEKKIVNGTNIINEGDNADNVYFIKSGYFEVYGNKSLSEIDELIQNLYKKNDELIDEEYEDKFNVRLNSRKEKILHEKKEVKLAKLGKGDFFGFFNYIVHNKFIFSIKLASEKGEFFSIYLGDFLQICNDIEGIIPIFNNILNQKKDIYLNQLHNIQNNLLINGKELGSVVDINKRKKKPLRGLSKLRNTYCKTSLFPIEKYYNERKQYNTLNYDEDNKENSTTRKSIFHNKKLKENDSNTIKSTKFSNINEKRNSSLYSLSKAKDSRRKKHENLSKFTDIFGNDISKKTRIQKSALSYPIFNKTYFSKNLYSNFKNYSTTLNNTFLISNNNFYKGNTLSTIESVKIPLSYSKNPNISNYDYYNKRINDKPFDNSFNTKSNLPYINTKSKIQ